MPPLHDSDSSAPRFPVAGRPQDEVLAELDRRLATDHRYASGRIVGSMISAPHPLAQEVSARYAEKNAGDPGVYPATASLEREAVSWIGDLLVAPSACGNLVSGGNEANILALWAARELARPGCDVVLVGRDVHVSYEKAARLLGLRLHRVDLRADWTLDVGALEAAIDARTVAIVGVCGSTAAGTVDDIAALSQLAVEHRVHLHVDAAFGGFVLPFLREHGMEVPPFDFTLPGVASMSVNPHKAGYGVRPGGCILWRSEALRSAVSVDVPYLAGGHAEQATLTGTRPGGAVLATWALLAHLGRDGYGREVAACMARAARLADLVRQSPGLELALEPTMNITAIRSTAVPVAVLAARMRARGWAVSEFATHLRVVVLSHLDDAVIDALVRDLEAAAAE